MFCFCVLGFTVKPPHPALTAGPKTCIGDFNGDLKVAASDLLDLLKVRERSALERLSLPRHSARLRSTRRKTWCR